MVFDLSRIDMSDLEEAKSSSPLSSPSKKGLGERIGKSAASAIDDLACLKDAVSPKRKGKRRIKRGSPKSDVDTTDKVHRLYENLVAHGVRPGGPNYTTLLLRHASFIPVAGLLDERYVRKFLENFKSSILDSETKSQLLTLARQHPDQLLPLFNEFSVAELLDFGRYSDLRARTKPLSEDEILLVLETLKGTPADYVAFVRGKFETLSDEAKELLFTSFPFDRSPRDVSRMFIDLYDIENLADDYSDSLLLSILDLIGSLVAERKTDKIEAIFSALTEPDRLEEMSVDTLLQLLTRVERKGSPESRRILMRIIDALTTPAHLSTAEPSALWALLEKVKELGGPSIQERTDAIFQEFARKERVSTLSNHALFSLINTVSKRGEDKKQKHIDAILTELTKDARCEELSFRDLSTLLDLVSTLGQRGIERKVAAVYKQLTSPSKLRRTHIRGVLDLLDQVARLEMPEKGDFITPIIDELAYRSRISKAKELRLLVKKAGRRGEDSTLAALLEEVARLAYCDLTLTERASVLKALDPEKDRMFSSLVAKGLSQNVDRVRGSTTPTDLCEIINFCARSRLTPLSIAHRAIDEFASGRRHFECLSNRETINLAWATATYRANCIKDETIVPLGHAVRVIELSLDSLKRRDSERRGFAIAHGGQYMQVLQAAASVPFEKMVEYFSRKYERRFPGVSEKSSKSADLLTEELAERLGSELTVEVPGGPKLANHSIDLVVGPVAREGRRAVAPKYKFGRPDSVFVEFEGPDHFIDWIDKTETTTPATNLRDLYLKANGAFLVSHKFGGKKDTVDALVEAIRKKQEELRAWQRAQSADKGFGGRGE